MLMGSTPLVTCRGEVSVLVYRLRSDQFTSHMSVFIQSAARAAAPKHSKKPPGSSILCLCLCPHPVPAACTPAVFFPPAALLLSWWPSAWTRLRAQCMWVLAGDFYIASCSSVPQGSPLLI